MATKTTITTTTSTKTTSTTGSTSDKVANQTTAAVADFFGASLGVTEDSSGAFKLNVLANDPGSAAILGLYTNAPSTPSTGTPKTASTVSGATVTINTDGTVSYQASDKSKAVFQHLAEGATATDSFAYVIKMSNGALSTAVATVTIVGANDAASISISGATSARVSEDAGSAAGGTITVTDVDDGQAIMKGAAGEYGSVSFAGAVGAAQTWTYTLSDKAQTLAAGDTVTENLVVTSADGTKAQTISVTIEGVNDAAKISGNASATITEDNGGAQGATLTVSDVDRGQNVFSTATSATSGTYGDFSFDQGKWSFSLNDKAQTLAEGETATETLTVKSLDGTATQNISVTIQGVNDIAAISGDAAASLSEDDGSAGGTLAVSDADHDQSSFDAETSAISGEYGDFSFNQGAWSFSLNGKAQSLAEGETATETLMVKSLDGTATQNISVTIQGVNDIAAISGDAAASLSEDDGSAGGTLAVSDADHDQSVFQSVNSEDTGGRYGSFSFNDGAWTFTLNDRAQTLGAGVTATQTLAVSSLDGSVSQEIVVTIRGVNDAATISGETTAQLTEDGATTARGALSVSDVDAGENTFAAVSGDALMGKYGTFTFNEQSGHWTYVQSKSAQQAAAVQALNSGQTGLDALTVSSVDGTVSTTINVSVLGLDEPKVFTITMDDFKSSPTQYINGFTDTSILDVPNQLKYDGATTTTAGLDLNFSQGGGRNLSEYDVILVGVTTIDDTTKDGDPSQII